MKHRSNIKYIPALALGVLATASLHANNDVTTTAAGTGSDWNTVAAGWSSGAGASANPGDTYEAESGGLVRSPRSQPTSTVTFPGQSLQIDAGAAMRFKTSDNGSTTTYVFNNGGLILNGGQAQAGDAINSVVSGFIHVIAPSSLTTSGPSGVLDTPGHPAPDTRTFNFTAAIDGSSQLTLMNGKTSIANPPSQGLPDFSFTGNNSGFSGGFLDDGGWLEVAGINSLGTGNVVLAGVDAADPSVFDSTVDFVSSGSLTLNNANDAILLDANMTFQSVTIDGTTLSDGSYTPSELTLMGFSANVAGGSVGTDTLTVGPVPEPATMALFAFGGLGALALRRKRA